MSAERRGGAKAQLAGVGPREKSRKDSPSMSAERRGGAKAQLENRQGWEGWDDYAPFYDWENTRTLGRRDVPFWLRLAKRIGGRTLELGCGTGRIAVPLARAGHHVTGIDRSAPMLERAARRAKGLGRARSRSRGRLALVRGDIRALPFAVDAFSMVLAPYGMLQSLVRDRDLTATLAAVARVLAPGGVFGIDLVPDVPRWRGVPEPHAASRADQGRRHDHTGGISAPGSPPVPHHLRAAVCGAPRPARRQAVLRACRFARFPSAP